MDLPNLIVNIFGTIATAITAWLIYRQAKEANKQTKELIEQNKFNNDYDIRKDAFDKIDNYFNEIMIKYKQDSYMTYFNYQNSYYPPSFPSNKFYLDNETDFLSNDDDFKEAILKTKNLLSYLDYVVGYFYYDLKRISEVNLDLILKQVRNYIVVKKEDDTEKSKEYRVSFLFYTFWCYDGKESKDDFSYHNLLKYFFKNNKNSDEFWLAKQFAEGGLYSFTSSIFHILEYIFPGKFSKEFIDEQKENLTNYFKEYLNDCSITNTNFLYFRFFIANWIEIFLTFIAKTYNIKHHATLKPILDRQISLTFTFNIEGFLFNIKNLCLAKDDKLALSSVVGKERLALEHYYEQYNNYTSAFKLYTKLARSSLVINSKNYYGKIFHGFSYKFVENYKTINSTSNIGCYDVQQIFIPTGSLYFAQLCAEQEVIVKILEECDIVHQKAKVAKMKNG